jgi:dihydroflavonol-4-reductase
MRALVLGAGGFLGVNLVEALIAAGAPPRCGRRPGGNVLALRRLGAELAVADLDDPPSLRRSMAGCDVVFHAAGHYPRWSFDPEAAMSTGMRQLEAVIDAAASSGVQRLIYVSSTATAAPRVSAAGGVEPSDERDRHPRAPGHGTYHDLKWAMEERALFEDRLEVVVACPGACIGPWDLRLGTSALLVALARGLDPPHPDGVVNVVDVRDVALALVALARHPTPPPRVLLSGGNHRVHELLISLSRRYGVAPPSPPLSPDRARGLADAEERRAAAERDRPRISREIVDLIVHGVPLDTTLAETALGLRWRTLEETLSAFDAWARRMRILPSRSPMEDHP